MSRILGNKTKRCLNGKVCIFIECHSNFFWITLTISKNLPKGTRLEEQNEKATVNLVTQHDITHEISIKRKLLHLKDADGDLKPVEIKIPYTSHSLIRGELIVSPEFYLPVKMLKYAQMQQANKKNPYVKLNINKNKYEASPSNFVPYQTAKPSRHWRG